MVVVNDYVKCLQVGNTVERFKGHHEKKHRRGVKHVHEVQRTGKGCFKVFKSTNFNGASFIVKDTVTDKIRLEEFSTVK